MAREESLRQTDHYRCRLCGQLSPITETLCTKPGCRAQLGIYGEIIMGEEQIHAAATPIPVVEEPKIKRKAEEKPVKEKKPVKDKKQKTIAPEPAETTFLQNKWTVKLVSLLLGALMILLVLGARNTLLRSMLTGDNWRAKYWADDAQNCLYAVILVAVNMLLVLFFYNGKSGRPVAGIASVLISGAMVGWFMFLWEGARCDGLSFTFFTMCALAVLSCALMLNTVPLKWPKLFLGLGILLGGWGIFELVIGDSVFFDDCFTALFLEAGILLVLIAVRNLRARK